MSQALIEALDALERQVASLSGAVKAADPAKIGQRAEEGAQRGSARAVADIPAAARMISEAARALEQALPAARKAAEWPSRRRWLVGCLITLIALLGLLSAFVGGVAYTRSGLIMTTEVGCSYLGGGWFPKQDGSGFVCWYETN